MKIFLFICLWVMFASGLSAQNPSIVKSGSPGQSRVSARDITLGPGFVIDSSADGSERQFPFAYKFGKNVLVSYSEHKDAVMAAPVDAMMISRDNGETWKEKLTNKDFYMSSMVEKNGILYGVVYFTYPVSSSQERMVYWTSGDMGRTWKKHEGVVNAPKGRKFKANGITGIWGSMLFHRGMQVMEDGSIQGVMYGYFAGEDKYSVVWVRSNDNCATWNIVSVVASGLPEGNFKKAEGYCEPTFAKTRDGSLLCVMRISSYLPLYQCRSRDNGKSWSRPVRLPGLADTAAESVDPQLVLMKNGILALTYGRPGARMAFSGDGCGDHWDTSLPTYEKETTGYTAMVEAGPGKLLLISDQGRTGARKIAIWGRFISVVPSEK